MCLLPVSLHLLLTNEWSGTPILATRCRSNFATLTCHRTINAFSQPSLKRVCQGTESEEGKQLQPNPWWTSKIMVWGVFSASGHWYASVCTGTFWAWCLSSLLDVASVLTCLCDFSLGRCRTQMIVHLDVHTCTLDGQIVQILC